MINACSRAHEFTETYEMIVRIRGTVSADTAILGERPAHTLIGEGPAHTLIGERPAHTLMGERPAHTHPEDSQRHVASRCIILLELTKATLHCSFTLFMLFYALSCSFMLF